MQLLCLGDGLGQPALGLDGVVGRPTLAGLGEDSGQRLRQLLLMGIEQSARMFNGHGQRATV